MSGLMKATLVKALFFVVFIMLQATVEAENTTATTTMAPDANVTTTGNRAMVSSVCPTSPSIALTFLAATPVLMAFVKK